MTTGCGGCATRPGGPVSTLSGDGGNPDEGEMNNTGDILETALILGRWGYTDYFHDAERILRCHLLPSQLRDISWIPTPDNPDGLDTLRNVAQRQQGAWGFPAPFGHQPLEQRDGGRMRFNTDVVGGTVGSLCEALREMTRFDEAGHWVNLLFDHETPEIEVKSAYTHPAPQRASEDAGATVRPPATLVRSRRHANNRRRPRAPPRQRVCVPATPARQPPNHLPLRPPDHRDRPPPSHPRHPGSPPPATR